MSTNYDKAYFIAKFQAIPAHKFLTGRFYEDDPDRLGYRCALGHCGFSVPSFALLPGEVFDPEEPIALMTLLGTRDDVTRINNGDKDIKFWHKTGQKQRILTALKALP